MLSLPLDVGRHSAPHDRRRSSPHDRRGETATTAAAAADDPLLADRLLAKLDRDHTNCDVQIGDGMDIGIMGENGEGTIYFYK
jgi:hypothetical protein